ncbi:MAG TPA: O-acetyl-ADP-ribose deacetylase [Candidatus Angelobacter sp.]|nr:O-acetyl-ADP-ribose deacetylase [Candidatus Angelobacter sp.]
MTRLEAVLGDLTTQRVDAVVNAANSALLAGGGVDGAIRRAGGPEIDEACQELRRTTWPGGLPCGLAAATTAGRLPAHWVIHTVGPRYGEHGGLESELLASCHRASLDVAREVGARTVAFPAVSCGIFGYPPEEAAPIATRTVRDYLDAHPGAFEEVRFVLLSQDLFTPFSRALARAGGGSGR